MPSNLRSFLKSISGFFIAGVLAILPVVITVAIIAWAGNLVNQFLGPQTMFGGALRRLGLTFATGATSAYIVGAILVLAFIFVIGVVVEAGAKKLLQRLQDAVLKRIPVIGNVYSTSRQLVSLVEKKPDDNLKAMAPVFCYFGRDGGPAALALLVSPERFCVRGKDYYIVIIPTAPVPIGGALLFVPTDTVQPADLSMEALISIYVSMGVTAPQFFPPRQNAVS
jgi:uncharacterized membrane protein